MTRPIKAAHIHLRTCAERRAKRSEGLAVRRRLAIKICAAGLALALGPVPLARAADPALSTFAAKVQPYIACLNRHSERAFASRARYLSWSAKTGPTGREKIVYGVYTLYEPADCIRSIEEANKLEPHDAPLEKAGSLILLRPFGRQTTITSPATTKTTRWPRGGRCIRS
jgi:Protein of unknown function (DUF3829)